MVKKIIISSIVVIVIINCIIYYLKNYNTYIDLEKFKPFTENNILLKENIEFKINKNLPVINAASACYPLAATIVENVYNKEVYNEKILSLVSTNETYNNILNGKTDIVIATEPSKEQKSKIEKANLELEYIKIDLTELVFFVNKWNTINNLSINDIKKMYNENKKWNDFGGKNKNIITYQLEKNNGSQTVFESIVEENKINKQHKEIYSMQEIINAVGKNKYGIGYAFSSFYPVMFNNKNTKIITINEKTYKDNNYPLKYNIYMIYNKDTQNENVIKLAEWISSKEGTELIKKINY